MTEVSVLAQTERQIREELLDDVERLENELATATNRLKAHEEALDAEYIKRQDAMKLLRKSQESGQKLKDALHTAEQDKIGLQLRLKVVEGERDRYKVERDRAEKEVERLTILMEEMERGFSSDE